MHWFIFVHVLGPSSCTTVLVDVTVLPEEKATKSKMAFVWVVFEWALPMHTFWVEFGF
jgi:hypothetical protein